MWFLENARLIPGVPAVGFALIILLGRRLPLRGAEIGNASMTGALVFSLAAAAQWIERVSDADGDAPDRDWDWGARQDGVSTVARRASAPAPIGDGGGARQPSCTPC